MADKSSTPAPKTAAKTTTSTASKTAAKPATSASKTAAKPATTTAAKPAAKPAAKSTAKPAAKPATTTAAKPAAKSTAKPATTTAAKPAAAVATTAAAKPAKPGKDDVVVVGATVSDQYGVLAEGAVAVQGPHALVVARFADMDAAYAVYGNLIDAEIENTLHIDGVLVVKADNKGKLHIQKMTDHSTRTGLKWGIVGGVVAGIFLPATIIGGAVALGFAGAAAGKARNLSHRLDVEKELVGVITPGTSGIMALVTMADAEKVSAKMAKSTAVKTVPVDEATAGAIKEAAVAADGTPKAAPKKK